MSTFHGCLHLVFLALQSRIIVILSAIHVIETVEILILSAQYLDLIFQQPTNRNGYYIVSCMWNLYNIRNRGGNHDCQPCSISQPAKLL